MYLVAGLYCGSVKGDKCLFSRATPQPDEPDKRTKRLEGANPGRRGLLGSASGVGALFQLESYLYQVLYEVHSHPRSTI